VPSLSNYEGKFVDIQDLDLDLATFHSFGESLYLTIYNPSYSDEVQVTMDRLDAESWMKQAEPLEDTISPIGESVARSLHPGANFKFLSGFLLLACLGLGVILWMQCRRHQALKEKIEKQMKSPLIFGNHSLE